MSDNKHIEKIINIFLFIGLFSSLLFLYFAQERLFNTIATGDNTLGPEKYLRILSIISIFITVIISIFHSRRKYSFSIYFAYFVLLIYIILNYLFSGADILDMAEFMHTKGIGAWVCFGLIFVSHDDWRYILFRKFLIFSAIFISLLSLYNFLNFGVGLWRGQALSKYQVYATNLVWIVPYVFLMLKYKVKLKWLRVLILLMGIILALVIQTRSFLIMYLIVIFFDFYHTRNKSGYIGLLGIVTIGFLYLIFNTAMLSTSLELLLNRGTQDTRTEQLVVFIHQLDFLEIITGSGFYTSYTFGQTQRFGVDNQWLYLLWWGGVIPVLAYFYLSAVIPIKMAIKGGLSYETKVECIILILWVLALTGLAIFSTMTTDFFFYIVSIILGRVLYKNSNNLK